MTCNMTVSQSSKNRQKKMMLSLEIHWASPVAQMVKNLPAVQDTWVQFLGLEDPLEKETANPLQYFAWRIPWMEESGRLQSRGSQHN